LRTSDDESGLAEAYAGAPSVLIDEFDARRFESPPDYIQGGSAWAGRSIFQLMNCNSSNSCSLRKILLAPSD
jgi:hypothetical protein